MHDDGLGPLPGIVTFAGFALAFAGFSFVASGVQLLSLFVWNSAVISLAVYLQIALGAAAVVTGFAHTQARGWAVNSAVFLAVALGFGGGGWVVYALLNGTITLVSLMAVGLGFAAIVTVGLARPHAMRAHHARTRLMEELSADP